MAKIVLDSILSGYNLQKINSNFEAIQAELQNKVLYRDNPIGEPNGLVSAVDMNGNDLLNVGTLAVSNLDIGGVNLNGQILLAQASATEAAASALAANTSLLATQAIEASIPATLDVATAAAVVLATQAASDFADASSASATASGVSANASAASAVDSAASAVLAAASAASINPANLVHLTGDESIAGIKTFTDSPVVPNLSVGDTSTKTANAKLVKDSIAAIPAGLPSGAIIDFAGTIAPTGFLSCPISATNISRTTYSALFAAIGTTWGVGDGSTTFGMPWFPADYAASQANGNVGTQTVGQNLAHSHTFPTGTNENAGTVMAQWAQTTAVTANVSTSSVGGTANLAAGVRVLKCVKY